ncbi:MAG: FxDxF family PEP-CTERM protein [Betaproteobacteria bacterium]|jgi:hypothetical protein
MLHHGSTVRLAIALAFGTACIAAEAATTSLGSVSTGATAFTGLVTAAPFNDTFAFNLPANGGTAYSVVNFPVSGGFGNFSTVFSSLALLSNPDGVAFNGDEVTLASVTAAEASSLSLNWGATEGGPVILAVTGLGTGNLGGLYSGAIHVAAPGMSVTPVPEPATWGMLGAGILLLGAGLRRGARKL